MVCAIIPARGGSKTIPKKNIIPFLGDPLITHSIKQANNSEHIDETYVSTDDQHIAEVSRKAGAKVINRPDGLAGDRSTTEAALIHAIEQISNPSEIIVLLQCTSPLRRRVDIDEPIGLVRENGFDSALSCCEDHSFYWKKEDDSAIPINYDPKERKMRQELEQRYQENGSIYVMKRDILESQHCRLGGRVGIHEMPTELSFEIDTPEDYRIVESIASTLEFNSDFVKSTK